MNTPYTDTLRYKIIAANSAEFDEPSHTLPWITSSQAMEAEARRAKIMADLEPSIVSAFKHTKPHYRNLSPGCRICGKGDWSCLFINGKCNCRCFYCPTIQDGISVPTTNQIPFSKAADYADYVTQFQFLGVSISGGEPLLTFDRTVDYIKNIRGKSGKDLHLWLYTNGTLVTKERLKTLRASGLNEIRFDISAVDYDLNKVRMAADVIPYVTVEIPAIPEDFDRLAGLLPDMATAGVQYLNLHQLRMTPYNSMKLRKRNYTFLHGESITILESEITALKLLQKVIDQNLQLPVNYCSFTYKHRYQQAATRIRSARSIIKGHESITENGFIRSMALSGSPEVLGKLEEDFSRTDVDRQKWEINTKRNRLYFHETLWPLIDFTACRLQLTYSEAVLLPFVSYHFAFKEIRIGSRRKIYIERRPVRTDLFLDNSEYSFFESAVLHQSPEILPDKNSTREEIMKYEFIQPGLQEYF